jgi:hypothetical protein
LKERKDKLTGANPHVSGVVAGGEIESNSRQVKSNVKSKRPVAQISFANIIKSGYKNSNTFLEKNRHDGLPT